MQDLVNEEMSKKQLKLSLWKANERQEKSKKHNEVGMYIPSLYVQSLHSFCGACAACGGCSG